MLYGAENQKTNLVEENVGRRARNEREDEKKSELPCKNWCLALFGLFVLFAILIGLLFSGKTLEAERKPILIEAEKQRLLDAKGKTSHLSLERIYPEHQPIEKEPFEKMLNS